MADEIPDYAIVCGPRAVFGLVGMTTVLVGTWRAEKTFDELGVKAFENANAAGLEPVAYFDDVSDINKEELDAACPTPWLILAGWVIVAVANLVPHEISLFDFEMELALPGMIGCLCALCIGFTFAWPIREAYNERDFASAKQAYQVAAAFGVVFLGSLIGYSTQGPILFAFLGGASLVASMHRMWKNRKMGESWLRNGRPNWNYVVCNGGGNLFAIGWFLVWLVFSAIKADDEIMDSPHIPIYMLHLRSALAFFACAGIVFLTVMTEMVTDEYDDLQEGLGAVGKFFGRFTELFLSLGFMAVFACYGAASFFPSETTTRLVFDSLLTIICVMQGRAYSLLFQKAIPTHDANRWSRLGRIILIVFAFMIVFQAFTGWISAIFAFVGVILILLGHRHIMDDRKRGKLYLDTEKPNPAPVVYSHGPILYTFGWIFMALAMSIPQVIFW